MTSRPRSGTVRDNPLLQRSTLPYGVPPFDRLSSADFPEAFDLGMKDELAEVQRIAGSAEPPTFANTIEALERSGTRLQQTQRAFYVLLAAHSDDTIQQIDAEYTPKFAAQRDAIVLDPQLFARVKSIYDNREALGLEPEQLRLVEERYRSFVRAGAALSDADKNAIRANNVARAEAAAAFRRHVLAEVNAAALVIDDRQLLEGLPEQDIAAAASAATAQGFAGRWLLPLQNTTQQPALAYLRNRALRERLFRASIGRNAGGEHDTTALVSRLTELRAEHAKLLGFDSHAAFTLDDQMAKTPENALALMRGMVPAITARTATRRRGCRRDSRRTPFPTGKPCIVAVPLGNRSVLVSVWKVQLGRVKLYLLDTDLEENAPWDRELSARLYGGDRETRIQQEIILGIGGVRALKALEAQPAVWHLNEGHAAFVVLQRIRDQLEQGQTFEAALQHVRRTTMFTTHTPVPAGRKDAFPFNLVETHLAGAWGTLGGLSRSVPGARALRQRQRSAVQHDGACAAHRGNRQRRQPAARAGHPRDVGADLAGRARRPAPGRLHHQRRPRPDLDLPRSWRGCSTITSAATGASATTIPSCGRRSARFPTKSCGRAQRAAPVLFTFIRERARLRWKEERVSPPRVVAAGTLLDPNALTLGFARRFTGYKRPELIFRNPERLIGILNAGRRPVQIVFAGKAHPADETGKHHLQQVYRRAIDPMFGGRIAFVDDYDLHVAHFLVQGCDVWLNNPRKPLEASSTSGMKASINGVPHCSIGDGWWAEGFNHRNGWLIEGQASPHDPGAVDAADADALYNLLETEIVPAFYDRDTNGIPRRWLQVVREAIISVTPRFSARRMVKQYAETMYGPATRQLTSSR